ncbi:uncharacterized protein LOC142168796 [Nicotiana tabacum]|uniref:Uncharacterized protein LOC142168796 n=1 Tax=Nicotiana tabacum TaxID=4097 RepID=A0AC58SM48_TOBAC
MATEQIAPTTFTSTPTAQTFTPEQYQQILQLLNSKPTEVTANATDLESESGASNHVTSKIDLLNNPSPLGSGSSVHLPNGDLAKITHSGSTNIFKDYKISDDLYTGNVLGIGSEANGLYILRSCLHKKQSSTPTVNTTAMQTSTQNKHSSINLGVWHQRLGHLPMEAIKKIGKLKTVRTNNGSEFINSDMKQFLESRGIVHQTTCVYSPQQNSVVERRHIYILEVARALRFQIAVPLTFLGDCVLTAVYIINRLPSTILKGKYPYEKLFNTEPSIDHMRVFGCLCYVVNVRREDKFSARALPAVFMGYSPTKKGYKLYDLQSKQFIISKDVVFKEHVFPFKQMKLSSIPVFPVLEPADVPDTTGVLYQDQATEHNAVHDNDVMQGSDALQPHSSHLQAVDDALPIAVRKPPRTAGPPKWLQDFVSTSCAYPMSNYLSYDSLSPSYARCLSAQSTIVEPKHYHEASNDERWVTVMQQEVTTLEENNTWDVIDLLAAKVPI